MPALKNCWAGGFPMPGGLLQVHTILDSCLPWTVYVREHGLSIQRYSEGPCASTPTAAGMEIMRSCSCMIVWVCTSAVWVQSR